MLKRQQFLDLGGHGVIFMVRQYLGLFLNVLINVREEMRDFQSRWSSLIKGIDVESYNVFGVRNPLLEEGNNIEDLGMRFA